MQFKISIARLLTVNLCLHFFVVFGNFQNADNVQRRLAEGGVSTIPRRSLKCLLIWRVCGDINLACADCNVCSLHTDRSRNHCPNRTVLGIMNKDGTMAEFLTLPVRNLHVVPDSVTDEEAVFTEPLAAACRVVEQGLVQQNDKVAVLGDGKLGLMVS